MILLGICIPNYNRINKLKRLILEIVEQIRRDELSETVQLCISDDCSPEDPSVMIENLIQENSDIDIKYVRKSVNMGMDHNFKDSVLLSDADYAWIIGNDDLPYECGIKSVVEFLENHRDVDFLVTPFDVFDGQGVFRFTLNPLECEKSKCFDTHNLQERGELFRSIKHNSGIFGFLSNVVFRRELWEKNKKCFLDKMNSIFIQMYMNIDAVMKGAIYCYEDMKIIKNVADDETNNSAERIARILIGLDGVVEHFFAGWERDYFKQILTDAYINGTVWELSNSVELGEKCQRIESFKNNIYRNHYVSENRLDSFFMGKEIIVFGAGDYGKRSLDKLKKIEANIIGVADSNELKVGNKLDDCEIMSVSKMIEMYQESLCWIVIASHFGLVDMYNFLKTKKIENIAVIY